jgi:hypothetical protein
MTISRSEEFLMLNKLGVAALVAATTLSFVAPSYAGTFNGTISTNVLTAPGDVFDVTKNGFLYSAGSGPLTVGPTQFGNLAAGGTAQSVYGPSITVAPSLATYTFSYSLGQGSTFTADLLRFDTANSTFTTSAVTLGAAGVSNTYDFTSIVASGVGTGTFRYGLLFGSTGGTALFSPVDLAITVPNSTAVPEPVEAPAFCMLLVAGGALVLRLRKRVTAEQAELN